MSHRERRVSQRESPGREEGRSERERQTKKNECLITLKHEEHIGYWASDKSDVKI